MLSIYQGMEKIEPTKEIPIRRYVPNKIKSFNEPGNFKPGFDNMYSEFFNFVSKKEVKNICSLIDAYKTLDCCWNLLDCETGRNFKNFI